MTPVADKTSTEIPLDDWVVSTKRQGKTFESKAGLGVVMLVLMLFGTVIWHHFTNTEEEFAAYADDQPQAPVNAENDWTGSPQTLFQPTPKPPAATPEKKLPAVDVNAGANPFAVHVETNKPPVQAEEPKPVHGMAPIAAPPKDLFAQEQPAPFEPQPTSPTAQTPAFNPSPESASPARFAESEPLTDPNIIQVKNEPQPTLAPPQGLVAEPPIPPVNSQAEIPANPFEAQKPIPTQSPKQLELEPELPASPPRFEPTSQLPPAGNPNPPRQQQEIPVFQAEPAPQRTLTPTTQPQFQETPQRSAMAQPAHQTQTVAATELAEERVYEVENGDNYWTISRKHYNMGRYFAALAEYNRHRIPRPERMKPGMKVLIPDLTLLEQRYPKLCGLSESQESAAQKGPQGYFIDDVGRPAYRVGKGDTLTGIAYDHLGRVSRWTEVYSMNEERIPNPNSLKIGTVLLLPADASQIKLAPEF